ncbi:MAG: hypothetical protein PWP54_539 [Thermosipho sp. (in: thermotogales)]|nr:hypothetical protein [Thermosipho sp. (in: thermotogales)]
MKKTFIVIFIFVCVFSFSLKIPKFVGINDEYFEFDGLKAFFDGNEITDNVINGLDFEEGAHSLRLLGQYEEFIFKITVDTIPPSETIFNLKDPSLAIFDNENEVVQVDFNSRIDFFKKSLNKNFERLDNTPVVACSKDEAGNIGGFVYIKPSVSNITPIDSQTPIGGINNKMILLSSKSPYKAIGKIIIPEHSTLFFEPGAELKTVGTAQIFVKGNLFIPQGSIISGKIDISLQQNGTIYLNTSLLNGNINSDGGKLLFIEKSKQSNINIKKTNVVIIKDSNIDSMTTQFSPLVVVENSTITNLNISNSRLVIINNSKIENLSIDGFSNVNAYNLTSYALNIDNFSNIKLVNSGILNANINKISYLRSKNTLFENLSLSNFSVAKVYKTSIHKLTLFKSKFSKRFSSYIDIVKDNSSILLDY